MAQYCITHTCGHESRINLIGPYVQREKRLEFLRSRACTECYRAEQLAAATAASADLPALVGSEKQVNWAMSIRAKALEAIDAAFARAGEPTTEAERANRETAQGILAALRAQTHASWWIDNREFAESVRSWLGVGRALTV